MLSPRCHDCGLSGARQLGSVDPANFADSADAEPSPLIEAARVRRTLLSEIHPQANTTTAPFGLAAPRPAAA